MTIEKLLDELSAIPGVTGSYIFHPEHGPIHVSPAIKLPVSALQTIGACVVRMLQMGKLNGLDIGAGRYRFDTCSSLVTPLEHGAVLMTICETKANCSLTATTAGMLAADLSLLLQKSMPGILSDDSAEEIEIIEALDASPDDIDIQEYLDKIEKALAEAIGPVAGMIVQDHINRWRKGGPAVSARLNELINTLAGEINDGTLIQEFRQKTENLT